MLKIKLRQQGNKKEIKYSIIILLKKKKIQSVYQEKIGDYVLLKQINSTVFYFSKNKLYLWRSKGVLITHKINKWLFNV